MEKLARKLAEKIGANTGADAEKIAVMAYGLSAFFQMVIIFTVITAVGLVFGVWYEALITFFAVGIMRSAIGGAHSSTYIGCLTISTISILLFAFAAHNIADYHSRFIILAISAVIYAASFILIYKYAPADSPNKPITRPEKIKRLRRRAFVTLAVYILITVIFALLPEAFYGGHGSSCALAFALSAIWQAFAVTPAGKVFIGVIDFGKK
ncbi:MAG: accessory gene regulator B family protein [Eubacteriales bacterium]